MKRFRELVAETIKRFPSDDFFRDFDDFCDAPEKQKHYQSYDDAFMTLDADSWSILKEKAINHFSHKRPGQQKQGFFNQLNEAFAYQHLLVAGCTGVSFLREGKLKTPDIRYFDGGTEKFCEVKTIGISDDEISRRDGCKVFDLAVYKQLTEGFLNKLTDDINLACNQIRAVGGTGLVFVLVRFDDIALDYFDEYSNQIETFCNSRNFENVVFKIGHLGDRYIRVSNKL